MDELEPDLRAQFDRLAEGAQPSDELVGRTLGRSAQIRRRRNAVTASGVATAVLLIVFGVAAVAGGTTGGNKFQVSGLGDSALPTVSSTTTTLPIPAVTPTHRRPATVSSIPAGTTTTTMACTPVAPVEEHPDELLLDNGDIQVTVSSTFGPAREAHYFQLEDGTTADGGFTTEYSPAQFGVHSYDEWIVVAAMTGCKERHTFLVDPSAVTQTNPTTTTTPDSSTTVPESTTVPDVTTSVP